MATKHGCQLSFETVAENVCINWLLSLLGVLEMFIDLDMAE